MTIKIYEDPNPNADITVSYKGSSEVDSALVFCPYVPLQFFEAPNKPKWQSLLDQIHSDYSFGRTMKDTSTDSLMTATARMQEAYPGDYIIEEYYDVDKQKFAYKLDFKTPEDNAWYDNNDDATRFLMFMSLAVICYIPSFILILFNITGDFVIFLPTLLLIPFGIARWFYLVRK